MTAYVSLSGKPFGVRAYEIFSQSIIVEFDDTTYEYTYASCGISDVEVMKRLALASKGLSTFIAQNKPKYARKFPRASKSNFHSEN